MKPILFSTPMVQAILEGRKSMTRRKVKFPKHYYKIHFNYMADDWIIRAFKDSPNQYSFFNGTTYTLPAFRPKYEIGDVLWVRETCQCVGGDINGEDIEGGVWIYRADGERAQKHLAILRKNGFVKTEREGKIIYYSPNYEALTKFNKACNAF